MKKRSSKTQNRKSLASSQPSGMNPIFSDKWVWILALLPFAIMIWFWTSSLSFVPVPWPDDSAFYFVAKELFKWPPRWVMLPQAPFEPTYRIFNFNTMPLYPILIGLGRYVGIDGSWALKFWPLSAFAATAAVLGVGLYRAGLPALLSLLVVLGFVLDPEMRWASTIVRPESLVGLCGMMIMVLLTLEPYTSPKEQAKHYPWYWDPVAFLLAMAAYAHFNAVHLVVPVTFALLMRFKRLVEVGAKTALYLVPWAVAVLCHPLLFVQQMHTQWFRLAFRNGWLDSFSSAVSSLFQSMGNPEPWPEVLMWTSYILWFFILSAFAYLVFLPFFHSFGQKLLPLLTRFKMQQLVNTESSAVDLTAAASWVLSSIWLWHTKPELWFVYFVHVAVWCFASMALLSFWKAKLQVPVIAVASLIAVSAALFGWTDVTQASKLESSQSWHWNTYNGFIDCIDARLQLLAKERSKTDLQVWDPTFPDITIELSRRHPQWQFTRTNDFSERANLAIQHGRDVDAVVVPETLNWSERNISAPLSQHPEVRSVWMDWSGYFLNTLQREVGWKPERYLCQKGRWTAFIYTDKNADKTAKPVALADDNQDLQ